MTMAKRIRRQQSRYDDTTDAEIIHLTNRDRASKRFAHERVQAPIKPLNDGQEALLQALDSGSQMIVVHGPAGTGKTSIVGWWAADQLRQARINHVAVARPPVTLGRTLGHLPGSAGEKATPFAEPLLGAIRERMGTGAYDNAMRDGSISLPLMEHMRGRDYKRSIVIVDEAQNMSIEEARCITTRIATGSTLIVMGDPMQTDIRGTNGLDLITSMIGTHGINVPVVTLTEIVRSDLCKAWIEAWRNQ